MFFRVAVLFILGSAVTVFLPALATWGYYKIYTPYGTGDTILTTWDGHGGANFNQPHRKWIIECLDGEAVIGILDFGDDFTRIWNVWCKFMFPYKPPSQGVYPYYPSCHVRNFTFSAFCYTPREHEKTVNTFITGFYGKQWNFIISRVPQDNLQPYKCCKTPAGYYLDYTACYYLPTHDPYWEYYNAPAYFLVYCATGYVMTGLAKKVNPYTKPDMHIDWIQCCRLGFGIKPIQPPPADPNNSTYTTSSTYSQMPTAYSYPQRQRGGMMAHSRFAVDPSRNLENDDDHSHSVNGGGGGYDMFPWHSSGQDAERQSQSDQDNNNSVEKPRIVDSHFTDQLKAFFAPTDAPIDGQTDTPSLDAKYLNE